LRKRNTTILLYILFNHHFCYILSASFHHFCRSARLYFGHDLTFVDGIWIYFCFKFFFFFLDLGALKHNRGDWKLKPYTNKLKKKVYRYLFLELLDRAGHILTGKKKGALDHGRKGLHWETAFKDYLLVAFSKHFGFLFAFY